MCVHFSACSGSISTFILSSKCVIDENCMFQAYSSFFFSIFHFVVNERSKAFGSSVQFYLSLSCNAITVVEVPLRLLSFERIFLFIKCGFQMLSWHKRSPVLRSQFHFYTWAVTTVFYGWMQQSLIQIKTENRSSIFKRNVYFSPICVN